MTLHIMVRSLGNFGQVNAHKTIMGAALKTIVQFNLVPAI